MSEDHRTTRAKVEQDFDGNPPRCATCLYFRREPHTLYTERVRMSRSGKPVKQRIRLRSHPTNNPIVDRCSFGNFLTKPHAICNEWRTHQGDRLATLEGSQ